MKKKCMNLIALMTLILGLSAQAQDLEHNKTRTTKDIKILEPSKENSRASLEITTTIPNEPADSVKEFLGAGSTGGGQGKDGFLRDLENGPELVCRYKMDDFTKDMHTFQNLLNKIEEANAGFAAVLREETKNINLCAVMVQLSPEIVRNQDGVVISASAYDQLAIRAKAGNGIDVYLANQDFNTMNTEEHQSFLLFHELLHSFTAAKPEVSYINRLRSANAMFYEYYSRETLSIESIEEIVEMYRLKSYSTPSEYLQNAIFEGKIDLARKLAPQSNYQIENYQFDFQNLIANYHFDRDTLDFLIEMGIDIKSEFELTAGWYSRTPMDIAVSSEKFEAMYYFLERGINFTQKHAKDIVKEFSFLSLNDYSFIVLSELNKKGLLTKQMKEDLRYKLSFSSRMSLESRSYQLNVERHLNIIK